MEFLFYRVGSEGDVFWRAWGEQDPACIESDFRQGKSATLQWPRSDRNRCEAFSRPALCRHFGTLAPCPTKLLPGWRRGPAIVPARCSMGQRLSEFSAPSIADPLLFLSRHAPGRMRLGAGQSDVKLALFSRLGAASGATNNQGLFLLGFHEYMMQDCPAISWSMVTITLKAQYSSVFLNLGCITDFPLVSAPRQESPI